ncbi:MAG TPA: ABC transporter ATP-binding protein [Aggregatilineales bacterium]|nr:ABC transporter ATP-binding protein [Anaerolineales bacterium]HRE48675.1 ABC transporter ATP-binding protein [Aggregatilineales bacterium]
MLLKVDSITANYGAIEALHGISLTVDRGEVVTLIGANGAGKSTTLNALSGIVKPRRGRITFDGQDITGWRPDQIAAEGLVQVPEGRQVIAPMSVAENLLLGAYRRRDSRAVRDDLEGVFERFPRLKERRTQKAGSLSGGEQQMLAVGRALMMRPKLLMLDEPSMGLAPLLVNEIFRIIAAIKASGTPILLVEQNARKALALADRGYVLERGMIAHSGGAAELQRDPRIIEAYLG